MKIFIGFDILKPSASEYAALTLMGVASAAATALINKYVPLPQLVFIAIWLLVVVLLSLALARSIIDAWTSRNLPAKLFIAFLIMIVFVAALKPTSTGFVRDDEIYSWGRWGVQHALGQPVDLHYTGAAYPQLFAYEIGSVFLAQGTHIPHFFAKLIAGLPSLLILIVLGEFIAKSQRRWANWLSLVLSITAMISIANLMYWAYADPLASALLLTSLALILQYAQRPEQIRLMVLASSCALVASLTKQPGLVWCLASLPIVTIYGVLRLGWKKAALVPCLFAVLLAIIWPVFVAPTFTSNHGVLEIAKNNGGLLASLLKSANSYIVKSPDFGLLLLFPIFVALINKPIRLLWLCFVLPYLVIWFTFGSYEKRHGIHVILVSVLLVTHALTRMYPIANNIVIARQFNSAIWQKWILLASLCIVVASINLAYFRHAPPLQDGNRAIFISQFGTDAGDIFDEIIVNKYHVFTASNYQYGALFNRTPLYRPDSGDVEASAQKLKDYLIPSQSSYTFTSGDWSYGPYSAQIEKLAQQCPDAFELIKKSAVKPQFSIYKIHQNSLASLCR